MSFWGLFLVSCSLMELFVILFAWLKYDGGGRARSGLGR